MHSMTLTCKCVKWKVTLMSLMVAVDRDFDTVYLRGWCQVFHTYWTYALCDLDLFVYQRKSDLDVSWYLQIGTLTLFT